ncbi:MAG: AAA family ATPase, partial [Phascolarctobacterium sp.]|nr:AAA family ATPase [Candidatus Phascolarctobacterium equi]
MKLKEFTTFGFKSFADKTELNFDKGITAIVGPNGSGKSNISDAIRWVLGEQSSKNLRGGKMEDVIFSGTAKRRQLGLAEVNLVFDNSDHQLPLEFDEVSLTRRLYRSGDSEYQINKKNVRLKDIVDLMADTGLGKGSMSIISQNKIDEILNARPEERRTIFEEAAGISKYRMRKKDAMRKLDETSENLVRINDIKTEIENQVAPMKEAAEKTMRFNELDGQLRKVRLTKSMRQIDNVDSNRQKLQEKQAKLQAEFEEKQVEMLQREVTVTELQHAVDKLNDDFANLQGLIAEKETALEKVRGEMAVLQERAEQSCRSSVRLEEKNKTLAELVKINQEVLDKIAEECDALEMTHSALQQKLRAKQQERDEAQTRLDSAEQEFNNVQNSSVEGMKELVA